MVEAPTAAERPVGLQEPCGDIEHSRVRECRRNCTRLSPLDPEASAVPAGQMMLELLNSLAESGESFAFPRRHAPAEDTHVF